MPLYVLDNATDALYPVDGVGDTNPGRAGSAVLTRSDFGASIRSMLGLAWDGESVFVVAGVSDTTPQLFSTGLVSGSAMSIGACTFTELFILEGMTSDGTTLWGVIRTNNGAWLVTINKTTGALTQVGTTVNFGTVDETNPHGLAWDGSHLWVVGGNINALIRVDKTTGLGTRIGSATNFGVSEVAMHGLAFDGTNLYGVGSTNDVFYTIDRTTGVATQVGSETQFGQSISNPHGIVSTDFPALANTAPTWTTTQTAYTLPANVAVNTVVASLVATDADSDTLTYSLTGSDAALFAISPAGVVTVASALNNDTTYNVTAVVSDDSLQATLDLSIRVSAPGETPPPSPDDTPTTPPSIPSGSFPQIEGLHEYRERFDVVRSNPFGVVRSNVEMIRHRGPTTITRPSDASGLTFALTIVDYTPVYAIPDLHVNDWIVEHNPAGWTELPDPSAVAVWVVQGPVEIGDAKKQVIVTKIT